LTKCGAIEAAALMVLVDTSVWIDYFNGVDTRPTELLDKLLGSGRLLTGDLVLAELLQGFGRDTDYRRARGLLLELPCADLVGLEIALTAADHYRRLRQRGITIRKTIDMLIGTYCLANDHELLHSDRDFDALEKHLGLRVLQ
jgi:predicted nucleic acid-binding protein